MALAASTSSANQTITLAAGSHTGHILVSHTGCTVNGAGIDSTTVVLDGTYTEGVRPGASVATFTLKNLTLDCAGLTGVTAPIEIGGGIASVTLENVRILDHARGSIAIYNRGVLSATGIEIIGNGGGINHFTGATSSVVRGMVVTGGQYGFVNVAAAGIDIDDVTSIYDYWACPTYEAVTATAYGDIYADVTSHVQADRSLYDVIRHLAPVATFQVANGLRGRGVQQWDRVEMSDGRWTQILSVDSSGVAVLDTWRAASKWRPVAEPTGLATVYRVTLGRYLTGNATRLEMQSNGEPVSPHWRSVTGEIAATPTTATGTRLDIIRAGSSNRDTDTGACHITENAIDASVKRWISRGGWSDQITLRGVGSTAEECSTDLGQDMGYTVDGTDGRMTLTRCHAARTGRSGFHVTGGPSDLYACSAIGNGLHNDGSGDYGCAMQVGTTASHVEMVGRDNLDGLVAGVLSAPTHVATEATGAPPYPFVLSSPFWEAS